jgi:flagellar basal-body rod protein FlgF
MDSASFVALSKQWAIELRLAEVANNVANSSTTGYRKNEQRFATYLSRQETTAPIYYAVERPSFVDLSEAPVSYTGNPLDLSFEHNKRAFFVVDHRGTQLLTRDGSFEINGSGEIVTASGDAVMGTNDAPIKLTGQDSVITVLPSGEVLEGNNTIGQLKLVEVATNSNLDHRGQGLYQASNVVPLTAGTIQQGSLEGSNVKPINELVDLIHISRDYESLQQLMLSEHSRIEDLIDKVPQV